MKKKLFTLANVFKRIVQTYSGKLTLFGIMFWMIISFMVGWNLMDSRHDAEIADATYQEYENIAIEIKNSLDDIAIPEGTEITIDQENIVVRNSTWEYYVTLKTAEGLTECEKNDGKSEMFGFKMIMGFATMINLTVAGMLIIWLIKVIRNAITNVVKTSQRIYKEEMQETERRERLLEEKLKAALEEDNS